MSFCPYIKKLIWSCRRGSSYIPFGPFFNSFFIFCGNLFLLLGCTCFCYFTVNSQQHWCHAFQFWAPHPNQGKFRTKTMLQLFFVCFSAFPFLEKQSFFVVFLKSKTVNHTVSLGHNNVSGTESILKLRL